MTINRIHACRAYLAFATKEHLDALANEGSDTYFKLCEANFPDTNFSDPKFKKRKVSFSRTYQTINSLRNHYEKSSSKAIFLQSPYIDHYPEWFRDLHKWADLAYGGYSLNLVDYFDGQYGSELVKNAKYLLASSQEEYINYIKYGNPNSVTMLTGNPLMYTLRKEIKLNPNPRKENQILLWAPHWLEQWEGSKKGFARWGSVIEAVFTFAEKNTHKKVIVRPHPLLRNVIDAYLNDKSEILNRESRKASLSESTGKFLPMFKKLLDLRNVQLSDRSMLEDVLSADMLITEGVSIIGYWASTGKPILVIRDSLSPRFNMEGENLLRAVDMASQLEDIMDWVKSTSEWATTKLNNDLIELSQSIHPTFKKSPLEIVAEHM